MHYVARVTVTKVQEAEKQTDSYGKVTKDIPRKVNEEIDITLTDSSLRNIIARLIKTVRVSMDE